MTRLDAPQIHTKRVSEAVRASVSFDDRLPTGVSLTGTPTVTVSGLTIASAAVTVGTVSIEGSDVAAGRALQFTISGGTAGQTYDLTIQVSTDESPAETLVKRIRLVVVAD